MNGIELVVATLFSSIVGSLHCVGMCTPFAVMAMGPSGSTISVRASRLASYHSGRLITYLVMGTTVALLSSMAKNLIGGGGAIPIIGWAVGLTMILLGITRLIATFGWQMPVKHSRWSQHWTAAIVALRRKYARGPVWLASLLWGISSTLLPCGWLYLFVLAAAAAPSFSSTLAMMIAFWIGTLPLLSSVAWGWSSIGPRWQIFAQPFAAACIISFGVFILINRIGLDVRTLQQPVVDLQFAAQADVKSESLGQPLTALEIVRRALITQLPCCRGNDVTTP